MVVHGLLYTRKAENRDNYIHHSLKNWALYVRRGTTDGPKETPQSAKWQSEVSNRVQAIDSHERMYVDEEAAELIHKALIRCQLHDLATTLQLKAHYRDGWTVDNLRKCRNKFWRFL